ncbi:MAG TPA: class I SAM-dependent methyltransferase [Bacteroidota bacterium]|nr:class I SAM-dependent methyltransferase [Bacteroidota bacterium]
MSAEPDEAYLLGVNETEMERLRFQHGVWKPVTDGFLDRIGVRSGWHCLDAGGGPGFVALDLRERVGEKGSVTLLDPSSLFLDRFVRECRLRTWENVRTLRGKVEEAPIPPGEFDLVFIRWVVAFVPDPAGFIRKLIAALRPGGMIAFQDYYYEGLSLFPRGGAFDGAADVVRAYYRSGGGDPYVTGRLPEILREEGLSVTDFSPHALAGGPGSGIMEWADRFFVQHIPLMAERGLMTAPRASEMLADWRAHRGDPDAIFFSPIVVDVAARMPG